jgi:Acyl-coenzyme A synthetases/AMP-(fatty) acid ligases
MATGAIRAGLGQGSQLLHHGRRRRVRSGRLLHRSRPRGRCAERAGHRIGTADVEGALVSHPAVLKRRHRTSRRNQGREHQGFCDPAHWPRGLPELEQKLKEHVRHVLGAIAVPAEIAFPDKLPKTRSGKIIRRLLKAQELGRDVGDLSTLEE